MAMITKQLKTNAVEVVKKDELSFLVDGMQTGASLLGITMVRCYGQLFQHSLLKRNNRFCQTNLVDNLC